MKKQNKNLKIKDELERVGGGANNKKNLKKEKNFKYNVEKSLEKHNDKPLRIF